LRPYPARHTVEHHGVTIIGPLKSSGTIAGCTRRQMFSAQWCQTPGFAAQGRKLVLDMTDDI